MRRVRDVGTASLHEAAGKAGALPSAIQALDTRMTLAGTAFPVQFRGGDNLWLHRAVAQADAGDVLVADAGAYTEAGHWGEILAVAAQARGIAGIVIDGGVRDRMRLIELGFPVFARSVCIGGTSKDPLGAGSAGAPIVFGGVPVHRGDLIVGDADGVVAIPADRAADVLDRAEARERDERLIFERLRAGETTLSVYGLPA
jgi:4-hydroxy-4-methyl-2-oxoglutarate aldolase